MENVLVQMGTVFLLSAAPIVELRGSIPLGIGGFGLSVPLVMFLAFLGNLLPILAVYACGNAWLRWSERRKGVIQRITERTIMRAQRKFKEQSLRHGTWALPVFVAIPIPMTGAVTGALAAFALGMPFKKAFTLIAIGVAGADVIVTLATTGTVAAFRLFL
jgi:uncharacterized membrane protein